jgi:16S rRNA processing protein RimM
MEQRLVVSGKELIRIAKITSTIGIKGGVKATPLFFNTQETMEILNLCSNSVYLYSDDIFPKPVDIKKFSKSKGGILLSIEELKNINDAQGSIGLYLLVDYKLYTEYMESTDNVLRYLGYTVIDNNLGNLGVVKNINRQAQVLLEIEAVSSTERLVPFVKDLIEEIDHKNRIIKTNLPGGIFE